MTNTPILREKGHINSPCFSLHLQAFASLNFSSSCHSKNPPTPPTLQKSKSTPPPHYRPIRREAVNKRTVGRGKIAIEKTLISLSAETNTDTYGLQQEIECLTNHVSATMINVMFNLFINMQTCMADYWVGVC